MQQDFLTGCANTLELSIQGQELLAREIADAIRNAWRALAQASERIMIHRIAR